MRKLIIFLATGMLWCNVSVAQLFELNKCFKIASSENANPKKFYNVNYRYEQSKFSINTTTGLITRHEIFTDSYVKQYNNDSNIQKLNKVELLEYELANYTSDLIIGKKYVTSPMLIELLTYPNLKVVQWEIRINLKDNSVTIIEGAMGHDPFDFNKFERMGYSYQQFIDLFEDMKRTFKIKCEENTSGSETDTGIASGTAFFISKKGYLLTNNHVIEGCALPKISYKNKDYETKLIATDKTLDLALLKAEIRPNIFFNFSKDEAKKLSKVYVAGYPLGKGLSDDLKISSGIVSSLKGFEDNSNEIQIDAPINPGNSGGPIINENGDLVAIAVSGLAKDLTEGINFGIKASAAENFLKSNKINPKKSMYSGIKDNDKLLKILEEGTVYTFCN